MNEILFNEEGYNEKWDIYKSYYHASKKIQNPEKFIHGKYEYTMHKTIKTLQINNKTYYEIINLRKSIDEIKDA